MESGWISKDPEIRHCVLAAQGGDREALGRLLLLTRGWVVTLLRSRRVIGDYDLEDFVSLVNIEIIARFPIYDPAKSAWTTWVGMAPFMAAQRHINNYLQRVRIPDGENTKEKRAPMWRGIPKDLVKQGMSRPKKRNGRPMPTLSHPTDPHNTTAAKVDAPNDRASAEARMANLTALEKEVIRARYGMDGEPPVALSELARRMKTTRENVRYIELHALRKLRA